MPVSAKVIPLYTRCAFSPAPLLPRRLQHEFEASLYQEVGAFLGDWGPLSLMCRLCLNYRPTARCDSTVALGWARLLARDLRWRVYEGTYEYVIWFGHFVKLADRGISVQATLLAWARETAALAGEGWQWYPRDELVELAARPQELPPGGRLGRLGSDNPAMGRMLSTRDESPVLDGLEALRDLVIGRQLRRIAPRVAEHLKTP